ncbi:MAG TPA: heme exporter protein CcmD [Xanthobacteraceae bacterium]|nr:heme exporter protein CcmD [Xanthobacteraceae bacterium]
MDLGPHAAFIVAAYAISAAVVAALVVWVIADHRVQMRILADLESRGVRRRSDAPRGAAQ